MFPFLHDFRMEKNMNMVVMEDREFEIIEKCDVYCAWIV